MALTYGVAALARPTFDVPFAEETKEAAFAALADAGINTVGSQALLFDEQAAVEALEDIAAAETVDLLLIMQVTFTDATMTVRLAQSVDAPCAIWALPEPRLGGRLRLNAYCGLNLAAHALGKAGMVHRSLYKNPQAPGLADDLRALAGPAPQRASKAGPAKALNGAQADQVLGALDQATIAVIGEHPAGFDTCEYDGAALKRLAGVEVKQIELPTLFDAARAIDDNRAQAQSRKVAAQLNGTDEVNAEEMDRSMRVFCAFQDIQRQHNAKGLAVRCWPEMFTEYGCAACGPMAMMNEERVPSACEADVYGSFTALLMQELAGEPSWMADLVDIDTDDNTGVLWHCGLAPLSMCDPEAAPEATIHTNRKMPLLHQFPLKPGRITLARVSQALNETKLVIGGAEVLRRPMAFTGTSGVVRFDAHASQVEQTIVDEGLEHHYALAYGDYRETLHGVAAKLGLPVLELTA